MQQDAPKPMWCLTHGLARMGSMADKCPSFPSEGIGMDSTRPPTNLCLASQTPKLCKSRMCRSRGWAALPPTADNSKKSCVSSPKLIRQWMGSHTLYEHGYHHFRNRRPSTLSAIFQISAPNLDPHSRKTVVGAYKCWQIYPHRFIWIPMYVLHGKWVAISIYYWHIGTERFWNEFQIWFGN